MKKSSNGLNLAPLEYLKHTQGSSARFTFFSAAEQRECARLTWDRIIEAKGKKTANKHLSGKQNCQDLIQLCNT